MVGHAARWTDEEYSTCCGNVQCMRRVYVSTFSSEASVLTNIGRASFRKFENSDALYTYIE